jgi:hypothetical protein
MLTPQLTALFWREHDLGELQSAFHTNGCAFSSQIVERKGIYGRPGAVNRSRMPSCAGSRLAVADRLTDAATNTRWYPQVEGGRFQAFSCRPGGARASPQDASPRPRSPEIMGILKRYPACDSLELAHFFNWRGILKASSGNRHMIVDPLNENRPANAGEDVCRVWNALPNGCVTGPGVDCQGARQ